MDIVKLLLVATYMALLVFLVVRGAIVTWFRTKAGLESVKLKALAESLKKAGEGQNGPK